MLDMVSVPVISLLLAGLAVIAVVRGDIPIVSDGYNAFWVMLAAYVMLAQYQPPKK
jgi:hypothetical protein